MKNSTIKNIAVVGLGLMGTPISSLLMKAGYTVTGFDLLKKQIDNLKNLGLIPANSPQEAAKDADLVILSLPNWHAVIEAMEGKNGVLAGAGKGQIVIDAGTSPPRESKAMAEKLAKKGIEWMDIPISGSSAQARVGNMVFIAGGKKSTFNRVKPVLDSIGKKTVYAGKHGDGATLKLVVNHILYLNEAAAIEGLVMGLKAGLNPDVMYDVITSGAAASDLITVRGKDMLAGNFSPKGPTRIAVKDMKLSLETGGQLGVILPMGGLYLQFLLGAEHFGWGCEDATVVMRLFERMAGLEKTVEKRQRKHLTTAEKGGMNRP